MPDPGGASLLLGAALILGLQHGIDWDHIAAITDLTGGAGSNRNGLGLASCYVLGHAVVVLALGSLAVWLGLTLPEWIDQLMEPLVGITLIGLAAWIFLTLARNPADFRLRSRWMLLGDATAALLRRIRPDRRATPAVRTDSISGPWPAVGVGVIHGVGAETPSQVVLFVAAAGAGGSGLGTLVLVAFVVGLMASNTGIALASLVGFKAAMARRSLYTSVGIVVALCSLATGLLFLTGRAGLLPSLSGI